MHHEDGPEIVAVRVYLTKFVKHDIFGDDNYVIYSLAMAVHGLATIRSILNILSLLGHSIIVMGRISIL